MRIFGGHDYYDSALAYGSDPNIVLVRYNDNKLFDKSLPIGFSLLKNRDIEMQRAFAVSGTKYLCGVYCKSISVMVGGTIYRGVRVSKGSVVQYFWDVEKFKEFLAENKWEIRYPYYLHREKNDNVEYIVRQEEATQEVKDYMIANKLAIVYRPVFEYKDEKHCLVNPYGLKKIELAKAIEPWKMFQELSMWIGGVLGGNSPETVTITDDKVLAQSHGFDKESFRGPRIK